MKCQFIYTGQRAADGRFLHSCVRCKRQRPSHYADPSRLKAQCIEKADEPPAEGPGTELTALFASINVTERADCNCKAISAAMDKAGVAGCRVRREFFLSKLNENAAKYNWWEKLKAVPGALSVGAVTLGGLYDEAVRRAEVKECGPQDDAPR